MITRRFLHRRCPGSVLGNPVTITKGKQKKIVYRYRDRKIKKSCYPCTQISLRLTLGRRKSGFEIYLNTRFIVNGVWKCSFLWIFVEYCHPNTVRSPLKLTSWLLAFCQHEFLLNVSSSLHREPIGSLLCRRPSGLVTHSFRDERQDRERLGLSLWYRRAAQCTDLSMVPRPRFMSIYAPLHISWSRPLEKERNKILGAFTARFIAASITRHASGGVEVRHHFHRAVRSGVILSGEIKHLRCFGI